MHLQTPGVIYALTLAAALLDGGGGSVRGFLPWPTPPARPPVVAPLREAILPTVRPRGPALALPIVARGVAFRGAIKTPTATASPTVTATPTRAALRPSTWRELERDMMVPDALVIPAPGEYRPTRVLHMAPGTTLDAPGVVLLDRGLYLHKADGATIRHLTVSQTTGDGIQVSASRDVLIEQVKVDRPGDGAIDIVEGHTDGRESWITVRDSTLSDGQKLMLVGDQDQPQDALLRVRLIRVTFKQFNERGPKAQRAAVFMEECVVEDWGSTAVDARLGARIHVSGTRFIAGKRSAARFQQSFGGVVIDDGTNLFQPWGGMQ